MITSEQLIEKYLKFFGTRGHAILPSASLMPENDPTVLFTTAGMHPLVPYLLGNPHPHGKRLANVQQCVRTGDVDEVGDDTHLTFFEMLGNWSLGDYFKREAIQWSWEFLTGPDGLQIDPDRLAISIFAGDADAPLDTESRDLWRGLGVAAERIAALPKSDNWWGPAGQTGPCGPDTEMFYWTGGGSAPKAFDSKDKRWVEIWNNVFMQYRKTERGTFEPLDQMNVDTGMGVERTVAVLNGEPSVFTTETFVSALAWLRAKSTAPNERSLRIVADHLRAATMILGDPSNITPSNVERGYVLRRLIRRAIRFGHMLGIREPFTATIADAYVDQFVARYPWLESRRSFIHDQLVKEEQKFSKTLARGLQLLEKKIVRQDRVVTPVSGALAFELYTTYGFPIEAIADWAREYHTTVDLPTFASKLAGHQNLSRTAAAGRFRSGLADTSEASTRLHTATHLLHAALRQILGTHVQQKGSNITPERLRFDFSHAQKLTQAELARVEALVNLQIQRALPVTRQEMSPEQARLRGALGFFGHKYTGQVSVYTIGNFSQEICTGPHVKNTSELGHFRVLKEEATSASTRRIKATVEAAQPSEEIF